FGPDSSRGPSAPTDVAARLDTITAAISRPRVVGLFTPFASRRPDWPPALVPSFPRVTVVPPQFNGARGSEEAVVGLPDVDVPVVIDLAHLDVVAAGRRQDLPAPRRPVAPEVVKDGDAVGFRLFLLGDGEVRIAIAVEVGDLDRTLVDVIDRPVDRVLGP